MTQEQFNEIKEKLKVWREQRHLTYENQREGFLGNVFEEISEYFRAKDDLEKIDALCDIAVFAINSFDINYKYSDYFINNMNTLIYFSSKLINEKNELFSNNLSSSDDKEDSCSIIVSIILSIVENLAKNLCFDFYKCMQETIKEISSRTGCYNESIGKFIKDEGYYSIEDLKLNLKLPSVYKIINILENDNHFIVEISTPSKILKNKFVKWYKADYESCRLLK